MNDPILGRPVTGERFVPTSDDPRGIGINVRRYLAVLPHAKDKRVLDLGCGSGLGSYLYSLVAKSVVGADYSDDALDYARHFPYPGNVSFEKHDLRETLPEGNFDLAVCLEFLEHIADPRALLLKLKDRGIKEVFFSLPLCSLPMSTFHVFPTNGIKDITNLLDPILRVERYELFDKCWVAGHGVLK